ncbi:MAG: hypothetical protein GX138_06895 [Firmicutes bacterium]|nr:hypothetical protein [Bacillota bacterium]
MDNIAISLTQLLLKGLPEGFLMTLAFHLFTDTRIVRDKFITLGLINILVIYAIRFLPIGIGVNTILSLIALILIFQLYYRNELSVVVRSIVTAVVIIIFILLSEMVNFFLLVAIFGQDKTQQLVTGPSELIKSLATMPSTLFLTLLIYLTYLLRKKKHGKI